MAAPVSTSAMEMLPSRLLRFFAKYPPQQYSVMTTGQAIPTMKQRVQIGSKPLSATNVPQESSLNALNPTAGPSESSSQGQDIAEQETIASETRPELQPSHPQPTSDKFPPNPFLPYKNPATGRWSAARIGLRQQADLFKLAREHEIEELLPASIKSSTYKQQRALERGLAVKGTGVGQQVKGHKWERTKIATLEKRRKAMEEMPELIRLWEQKGHGRGWRKFPK